MKILIRYFFIWLMLGVLLTSCKQQDSDFNKIITISVKNMPSNSTYFYDEFFIQNRIKKDINFLTKDEILEKEKDDFYYLYKPLIENNKAVISFLKVKNGKMYVFELLKNDDSWKIIKKDSFQTKVEENEGTRLYYQVEDSLKTT